MNIKEAIREDLSKRRGLSSEYAGIKTECCEEAPYSRGRTRHTFRAEIYTHIMTKDDDPYRLVKAQQQAEQEIMNVIYSELRHELQKCAHDLHCEFGPGAHKMLAAVIDKYL